MIKNEFQDILDVLPDDATIEISVDVSTNEDNSSDRAFAKTVIGMQCNYGNSYTILTKGTKNFLSRNSSTGG